MKARVPTKSVIFYEGKRTVERPKSMILTSLPVSEAYMTLSSLISLWTTPKVCMCATAFMSSLKIPLASFYLALGESVLQPITQWSSDRPSMSSIDKVACSSSAWKSRS